MKYAIFGTGKYYSEYKKYLNQEDIVFFLDNNSEKWGTELDGKQILSPSSVNYDECEFVLVLILRYSEVVNQLKQLGVHAEKIKLFYEVGDLLNAEMEIISGDERITFSEWNQENKSKKVLIVVHELTRNGVSVVLMNTAILLRKMGYKVLMTSLIGGGLEEELVTHGIDYSVQLSMFYRSEEIKKSLSDMQFVITGTVGVADVVDSFSETDVPIVWWMHESNDRNFLDFSIKRRQNIHYYAGGKRVEECFHKYYPERKIEKLLYFLPEKKVQKHIKKETFRVAVIGFLNYRKAQDVFIKAIEGISEEKKRSVEFDLIGVETEPIFDLEEALQRNAELRYLGELTQEGVADYFSSLDLLVCPSRDDPMPVVVTQAMQNGIPCIVSSQVGQSEYIENGKDGYVFETENVNELRDILEFCILNPEKIKAVGEESRKIYKEYFSENAMEKNLKDIINKIVYREEVL